MEIVGRGGGGKDQVGKVLVIDGVGKTFCEPDEKFGGWTWLKGELNWIRLVSAAVAGLGLLACAERWLLRWYGVLG